MVSFRALGQQHRRHVRARVEVHRAGVHPADLLRRGDAEAAQHGVLARPRQLGLGRRRPGHERRPARAAQHAVHFLGGPHFAESHLRQFLTHGSHHFFGIHSASQWIWIYVANCPKH